MLSASRARFSRYPSRRLFYSTGQAGDGPVVTGRVGRGFKRFKVQRSGRAVYTHDLNKDVTTSQIRRRQRILQNLRAFVTKPLKDEQLHSSADRLADESSAAGGSHNS